MLILVQVIPLFQSTDYESGNLVRHGTARLRVGHEFTECCEVDESGRLFPVCWQLSAMFSVAAYKFTAKVCGVYVVEAEHIPDIKEGRTGKGKFPVEHS